jgi:branched-chain amino acid transport system permease protein
MEWIKSHTEFFFIPLIYIALALLDRYKVLDNYVMQIILLSGINIIMTLSVNLVNGMTGQSTMGHAGFMSVGAYSAAFITTVLFNTSAMTPVNQTIFFIIASILGGCVAALFGLLIGLPTLRLKGDYLAIVSLGFGEVIRSIIRLMPVIGGARGLTGIPKLSGLFWIYVLLFITIYVCRNFMDSKFGRACFAIRDNDIAADTMGINVSRYKILAFILSAFIAGIAGSLYAHTFLYLSPDVFGYAKSTDFLVYLYAGGVGCISGSILGALALTILPEILRFIKNWRLVMYGALLVLVILFRPVGLFGGKEFGFLKLHTGGIQEINFDFLKIFRPKKKILEK